MATTKKKGVDLNSDLSILRDAVKNKPKTATVPNPVPAQESSGAIVRRGRPKNPDTMTIETSFQKIDRPVNGPAAIVTGTNTRKGTKALTIYLPADVQARLEKECSNVSGTVTGLIQYALQHLDGLNKTLYVNYQKKQT